MGIAATGAILREMILHNDIALDETTRWMFVGAVGATVLVIAALLSSVKQDSSSIAKFVKKAQSIIIIVGLLIIALGLTN